MSSLDGIDMLAFHHHFDSGLPNSPLYGTKYRDVPELTWEHLMNAHLSLDKRISEMRQIAGSKRLAMTEGHFSLPGRNRNEVLSSWAAGVAYARCANVIMRNSDVLDVATLADFFGNVWQVNALMIPTPIRCGEPYLQPVGAVMSLFGRHQGKYMNEISYDSSALDAVCSVSDNVCHLHAVNTDMTRPLELSLEVKGKGIQEATAYYVSTDPTTEITPDNVDAFTVKAVKIENGRFSLPAASVAAIDITFK